MQKLGKKMFGFTPYIFQSSVSHAIFIDKKANPLSKLFVKREMLNVKWYIPWFNLNLKI